MLKSLVKKFRSQTISDPDDPKDDGHSQPEVTFDLRNAPEAESDEDESSTLAQSQNPDSTVSDETKSLAVSQTSDYCASDQSLFACSIAPSDLDSNSRDSLGYESGLHSSSGDGSVFVPQFSVDPSFQQQVTPGTGSNAHFGPGLPTIPQCSVPSAFRPVSGSGSATARRRALIRPRGSFDLGGRQQQAHHFSPLGQRDLASRHCSVDGGYTLSPALAEEGAAQSELVAVRDTSTPVSYSVQAPQWVISLAHPSQGYPPCPSAPPMIRSRCFSAAEKRKRTSAGGPDPESPAPPDKFAFFNQVSTGLSLGGSGDRAGSCEVLGREKGNAGSGILLRDGGSTLSASSSLAFPTCWTTEQQATPAEAHMRSSGGSEDLAEQTGLEDDLEIQEVLRTESTTDSGRGTPLTMLHRPSPVVPVGVADNTTTGSPTSVLSLAPGATLPRVSPRKRAKDDSQCERERGNLQGSLLSLSDRRFSDATGGVLLSTSAHCELLQSDRPRLNFDKMREKMSKSRRTRGFTSARAKIKGLSSRGSSG